MVTIEHYARVVASVYDAAVSRDWAPALTAIHRMFDADGVTTRAGRLTIVMARPSDASAKPCWLSAPQHPKTWAVVNHSRVQGFPAGAGTSFRSFRCIATTEHAAADRLW